MEEKRIQELREGCSKGGEEVSRVHSLRGCFSMDDNALSAQIPLFEYEANDLTKGWVVEAAYIWPRTTRKTAGSVHAHMQICASLQTDQVGSSGYGFADLVNASDNRQIGWLQSGYLIRQDGSDDYLSNGSNPPNPAKFVIDPEHVISHGLWLQAYGNTDADATATRTWNYMVLLRPKKMAPSETILHLIKNVAQDITN